MSIKKSILARVQVVYLVVSVVALIIFIQILTIQFVEGKKWREEIKRYSLQYRIKKATRGNIYSANHEMLATSIPLYKLSIDPMAADDVLYKKNVNILSKLLSDFFGDLSPKEYLLLINQARKEKKRYLILNTKLLSFLDKKKLETWPFFREGQYKSGVIFEKVEERTYPFKGLARRTVGFVNENGTGAGIEKSFEKQLAGIDGRALYQKISGSEWKPIQSSSRIEPINGYDVYTSLDINTQDIAEQELKNALLRHQANYGCVVIMEVKTGQIKAMVNLGKTKDQQYAEVYNYAIDDLGSDDPGSTFKTASMMALLEDTTLTLNDSIETGGGEWRYYDRVMRDDRVGGWGKLTIQQAFEFSSNVGISKLISRHFGRDHDKYINYLKKFGLDAPLESLQMEGMTRAYFKSTKDQTWSGVTLPWMSVGYESKISPVQLLTFYNAIANDGFQVQPYLVTKVMEANQLIESYQPIVSKKKICSEATLEKLKILLEGVVERGTARKIQTDRYKIAGKTGTSQKLDKRGRYTKKYKTSFVGYFPADQPRYTCIVVIDEPKVDGASGGEVCAPVFRAIADKLFKQDMGIQTEVIEREVPLYLTQIPSNQPSYAQDMINICQELGISVEAQNGQELVAAVPRRYLVELQEREIKPNIVPNVKGLTLRDALYLLENKGLKVSFTGSGRVKTQSLMPGSPLRAGEKIIIQLQ